VGNVVAHLKLKWWDRGGPLPALYKIPENLYFSTYGKAKKFIEESLKLEVKRCIHCGEKLHRRQTIWLANEKK
jgi:hypothetical protein